VGERIELLRKTVSGIMLALLLASLVSEFSGSLIKKAASVELPSAYPLVYVCPNEVWAEVGETFTVSVVVYNLTDTETVVPEPPYVIRLGDLYSFDVQLSWDPTVIKYVAHTVTIPVENYLSPVPPSPYAGILYKPVQELSNVVDEAGNMPNAEDPRVRAWIAYASKYPAGPFNGNGTLFVMTFEVLKLGESPIEIVDCSLSDNRGEPIAKTRTRRWLNPPLNGVLNPHVQGIDVSHHQGDINWSEVYVAGYRFAFVKASGATEFMDDHFEINMIDGHNAGVLMGAYHFAYPEYNDPVDEAQFFVSVAGEYLKEGYLRPVLDLEDDENENSYPYRLGKEALSNWVHTWMETVKSETGIEPIIYVNSDYANNYLNTSIAQYNLWIAHWTYDPTISPDTGIWESWDFWQYSDQGTVPGIAGNVDLDLFNGDMQKLQSNFVIRSTPKITSIDPSQPIAFAYQYLTIIGEGFVPDSYVNFSTGSSIYRISKERTRFINPNKIEVVPGFAYIELPWKVWVINPDGSQSNKHDFQTRRASDEEIEKVLLLALDYAYLGKWTVDDAVIMTAIAGGESGWSHNAAGDAVKDWGIVWDRKKQYDPNINSMGFCSWGYWQILMPAHLDDLKNLAHTDDYTEIAEWLRDPNNNLKAAYKVWNKQGFGAWSAYAPTIDGKPNPSYYKNPEIWNRVTSIAERISIFKCPVNITITDEYGRTISEIENQIPGASFEYFNATDTKIFRLPLNLTYHVQINATAYGNITIGQITPTESIYEIAFSQVTFNLTNETIAQFNLLPFNASYTLEVDENGDGVIDYELTPDVETLTSEYDIGITEIVPSKTVVGQGYKLTINVTIMNYGAHTETFNVTVYANTTIISQTEATLTSGNSTTISFTWNTSGFTKGNYTISAYAWPVSGETDTVDNTCIDGIVTVTIPGDVDGDHWVFLYDAVKLLSRYGTRIYIDPKYDPVCDIDDDGRIFLYDAVILLAHYGQKDP
jgi:lysozyme